MSVIGYLLDAGKEPDLELVDELVTYIAKDTASYADDVAKMKDPEDEETTEKPDQTMNAYEQLGDGYL